MVKQFKGQVKISDVQKEFDNILARINSMIDTYNASLSAQDIDYSIAAEGLSPTGYCLTVGGLKQLLTDYEGSVFGCKAYKISNTQVKVTSGLLFYDKKVYNIKDAVLNTADKSTLYYDITNRRLTFGDTGTVTTTWSAYSSPVLTNSNGFGNIYASINSGNAYKATNKVSLNSSSIQNDLRNMFIGGAKDVTLTWNFPQLVKLNNISLSCTVTCLYPYAKSFSIEIRDIDGTLYGSKSGFTPDLLSVYNFNIPINNRKSNGIKIIMKGNITSGNPPVFGVGNLSFKGAKQITTIVDTGGNVGELVKITDLNMDRNFKYANVIANTQLSGLTKYRYTMNKVAYGTLGNIDKSEAFNNSTQGNFFIADIKRGSPQSYIRLFGINIEGDEHTGHRTYNSNRMFSPFYIPKGLPVPFVYTNTGTDYHKARKATKKLS